MFLYIGAPPKHTKSLLEDFQKNGRVVKNNSDSPRFGLHTLENKNLRRKEKREVNPQKEAGSNRKMKTCREIEDTEHKAEKREAGSLHFLSGCQIMAHRKGRPTL